MAKGCRVAPFFGGRRGGLTLSYMSSEINKKLLIPLVINWLINELIIQSIN